jgi:hypothetical protein
MQDLGDWTHAVRLALKRDTRRPVWIQGPFSSPYDTAVDMDNQILVAGGIGITPAISVMRKHKATRRSNLIWAVRDPHMLEFFVKHGDFSSRGWNLFFYTGKQPLYVGKTNNILTPSGAMVHIIRARPNLRDLIPNIIYSIESGEFVPEEFIKETKVDAISELQKELVLLDELQLSSREKMSKLITLTDNLGLLFSDLMEEITKGDLSSTQRTDETTGEDSNEAMEEQHDGEDEDDLLEKIRSTKIPSQGKLTRRASLELEEAPSPQLFDLRASMNRSLTGGRQLLMQESWVEKGSSVSMPWKADATESKVFVRNLDKDHLSTWGALYCGGQGPLADALKKTTKEVGISVALESFKW